MRTLSVVLLLLCVVPMVAFSQQTRYISDELALDLRSGPGNQYRIQQMLPAGTKVRILEEDSGWARVRLDTGVEGWVLTRMLSDQPSARSRLEEAESSLEETLARNVQLSTELIEAQTRIEALENDLNATASERDRVAAELSEASQGLELYDDNQDLRKQVIDLRRDIQDLTHEAERLRGRDEQRWFLVGSAVLGAGLFLGLIIPRIRWRRQRSSWGSGGL